MADRKRMLGSKGSQSSTESVNTDGKLAFYQQWQQEGVAAYFKEQGYPKEAEILLGQHITGRVLEDLTEPLLEKIGVKSLGKRLELLQEFKKLLSQQTPKVKPDPAHSTRSRSTAIGAGNRKNKNKKHFRFTEAQEKKLLQDYHALRTIHNNMVGKSVGIRPLVELLCSNYDHDFTRKYTVEQVCYEVKRLLKQQS